jgi:hypothetical protein
LQLNFNPFKVAAWNNKVFTTVSVNLMWTHQVAVAPATLMCNGNVQWDLGRQMISPNVGLGSDHNGLITLTGTLLLIFTGNSRVESFLPTPD